MNMYAETPGNVKRDNKHRKRRKLKKATKIVRALMKLSNRNKDTIQATSAIGESRRQKRSFGDFVGYMISQYEGADVLMDISSELLKGSESIFKNRPRVQKSLSFLGKALPFLRDRWKLMEKTEIFGCGI